MPDKTSKTIRAKDIADKAKGKRADSRNLLPSILLNSDLRVCPKYDSRLFPVEMSKNKSRYEGVQNFDNGNI